MRTCDRIGALTFLLLLSGHSLASLQEPPEVIISRRPLARDWDSVITVRKTHMYGVYEPAEAPDAWMSINALAPGPDGSVFIIDYGQRKAYWIKPDLGVVGTYGAGEGAGPGEFRAPVKIAWDGSDGIFILDRSLARISEFALDGSYRRVIPLGHQVMSMVCGPDDLLWITRMFGRPFDEILILDKNSGEEVSTLEGGRYANAAWNSGMNTFTLSVNQEGVLASPNYPYEIQRFNTEGKLVQIFGRELDWLRPMAQDEQGVWGQEKGYKNTAVGFPKGHVMVMLHYHGDRPEGEPPEVSFDVFLPGGQWLTTVPGEVFEPEGIVFINTVATDGALWAVSIGDWPVVTRYEITFGNPFLEPYRSAVSSTNS